MNEVYLFSCFLDEGLHCIKLVSGKVLENEDHSNHIIEVLVKYSHGNFSKFKWDGKIGNDIVREVCQTYVKNTTGIHFVTKAWIRQLGSNSAWKAKSLFLQENVDAPYYVQYSLSPRHSEFLLDR